MFSLLWLAYDTQSGTGSLGLPKLGTPTVVVTYKLNGTAEGANITYTDGSGNVQQMSGKAVPLPRTSDGGEGLQINARHGAFVSILAQNTGVTRARSCARSKQVAW